MKLFRVSSIALIVSFVLPAFSQAEVPRDQMSPRFLVHLLDYLAKDYGGAVENGKVTSQSEYDEQKEFSATALSVNKSLGGVYETREVSKKLSHLRQLILSKAEAKVVSALAREIQAQVIKLSGLELAPAKWPSLGHGKQLFAQSCVACHGATGAGDGSAGAALDPKPANFLDSHMRALSPFQAFNTIRLGVPGTGMAAYHALSDKDVWDLAFYVVSLRYAGEPGSDRVKAVALDGDMLKKVATLSDEKLEPTLQAKDDQEKVTILAALRTRSDDDESGGNTLALANSLLNEAEEDYAAGKLESAKTKALKAYLEGIEPIEPRIRASDPNVVAELEEKMAAVRMGVEYRKTEDELRLAAVSARAAITKAGGLLKESGMSPWLAFLAAAAILLREGFEAVLVVIALLGVIRAAGSRRAAVWVHGGWVSALGLGAVGWFFSGWLLGISGAQRETMEGATSLLAVAVLLVVGFWLHSQTEIGRWKEFIHARVQRALDGKNLWALASISFIAVFREAFETVLFLRAVWLEGGDGAKAAMATGVVVSLSLVILSGWLILRFSARVPIRRLFEASALVMVALAIILTGKGLHAFQETGALSVTGIGHLFRVELLGFYPTAETALSQAGVLLLIVALWLVGKRPSLASREAVE